MGLRDGGERPGVFLCAKHCIPAMQAQGGGSVVIIASDSSYVAAPNMTAYCTSKGAVLMLTRALAVDNADDNIRVDCVCGDAAGLTLTLLPGAMPRT